MITEDKIFCDRIEDIIYSASEKYMNKSSLFLNPHQQALAERCAKSKRFKSYVLVGGHESAIRKVFIAYNEYTNSEELILPIVPLSLSFRNEDKVSHSDVLGSLMGLLIKRESVGDILVGEGIVAVFVLEKVATVIENELKKIGRVGVKVSRGIPEKLPTAYSLQPKSGTVSSFRLDCIISFVLNISRRKSAQIIKSGMVTFNYFECDNISCEIKEGDIFSVKGKGKFVIKEIGGETSKGRIHIVCCKYI